MVLTQLVIRDILLLRTIIRSADDVIHPPLLQEAALSIHPIR